MAPSTTLSHALHPGPQQGPPLSKRERLGTAATSLKRLVQDEWDKAGSKDPQPLPLPRLRAHSARSSSARSSVSTAPLDPPHFAPPPSSIPPSFDRSRYPPSPPDTPDLGDTPVLPSAPFEKGKGRQSFEQEEEDAALNAALEASLHDGRPVPQQPTTSETELREVLEQSRDDEAARQEQVAAQEQSDLTAALLASSVVNHDHHDEQHTLYRPRSQTLPSFSATDFASSAYPPEKAREFPMGRPALPPGAGSAWDDEQREMELLAEAIRISKEEEEERLRFEVAEVEEALRRSELGATTSGDDSAESIEGGGGSSNEASTSPRSPRTQRRSWLRPPLLSKLATDAPSSPPSAAVAPLPPPRPLPTARHDSVATVDTYRTAPEGLPFSNLDAVAPAPPPRPARPAPPPPSSSTTAGSPQKPSRLPPAPPADTSSSSVPFPSPQNLAIPESYRDDNNGSPYELPFLTPSNSLRSNGHAQQHLRPGLAGASGQWDSRSGGGSSSSYYDPLSTSSHSGGEPSRRVSMSTSGRGADGRSESSANSADSGPPMSPLSVRNPDGTPSVSSRASTLSSVSSASDGGEREGVDDGHRVESLWIEDLPMFPAGLTGLSAYAGRSMSAIDETTEPASSVYATEQGGADEHVVEQDRVRARDDGRFPDEVSLASSGASTRRHCLPDEPALDERTWLAGGGGGGAQNGTAATPRPPMPQRESSSRTPTLPPGAAPAAYGQHVPPRAPVEPQPSSASATAAAVAHDMHEDGLRFGHPAACSRELAHACPADGLDSSTDVPARIELSCVAREGEAAADEEDRASRAEWAIEAHSWVALVRALMWHGDSTLSAARADLAQSRSQRCAATARLEFRPDDEGLPVLRLVVALVPPSEAASHLAEHRELSVSHPARREADDKGKGKGRAQASAAHAATSPLATFALPDLLHLPTRLSSLAIQLYTLRHLAGIARATQPAQQASSPDGHETGYSAMRELADAISALARAAQDRERRHDDSAATATTTAHVDSARSAPPPASASGPLDRSTSSTSAAATPTAPSPRPRPQAPEEQNARLVTRLRDRLRRLKRRGPSAPASGTGVASSGSSAASVEAVSRERGARDGGGGGGGGGQQQPNKLVKPMPRARATAVRRSERVLAAEEVHEGRGGSGGGVARPAQDRRKSGVGRTTAEEREMRYLPVL
ncbi:hypothetical protein JCM8208_006752 [Rhodotorula glutinis]